MNKIYSFIIATLILIASFTMGYFYSAKVNGNKLETITVIDTVYADGKAIIEYVDVPKIEIDTVRIETIVNGLPETITKIDTIYVTAKDIIASIDTSFVSSDSLMKSDVSIRYSYNNQMFNIKNVLTLDSTYQKHTTDRLSPISLTLYTSGNENSLELGFGVLYNLNNKTTIGLGYSTSNKVLIQYQYRF